MKRGRLMALVAALVATCAACGIFNGRDVRHRNLLHSMLAPDDTVYEPDYRESRFREVVPGMRVAELRALLGEPLSIHEYDAKGLFIRSLEPRALGQRSAGDGLRRPA